MRNTQSVRNTRNTNPRKKIKASCERSSSNTAEHLAPITKKEKRRSIEVLREIGHTIAKKLDHLSDAYEERTDGKCNMCTLTEESLYVLSNDKAT